MRTQNHKILSILALVLLVFNSCQQKTVESIKLGLIRIVPENISFRDSGNNVIKPGSLGISVNYSVDTISSIVYKLKVSITSDGSHRLRDIEIPLEFVTGNQADLEEVRTSFHWVPNLKKKPEQIIAQHVFRSPAIILSCKESRVSVMPDLEAIKLYPQSPYYLDLNFRDKGAVISYGLSNYRTDNHVYYQRGDSAFLLPQKTQLGLYIICSDHFSSLDILKKTNSFMWNTFAAVYLDSLLPQVVPFNHYAEAGYSMALSKYWINGPKPETGGIALSTFLDKTTGIYRGRDFKDDLWFHSWFNNARTAYGLYLWGEETGNSMWKNKALATMNLLLSSPQRDGFFPTFWVPEKQGWVPSGQGGGPDLYHGNREYLQRSIAACRASFALMAIPENKKISPHNYKGSTFNGEFIGAMAENYGHSGYNERSGQSGFHWGTGSALTTAARFRSRLGDIYLDEDSQSAIGVDGIIVRKTEWGDTIKLTTNRLPNLRPLKIYCDQDDVIGKKVIIDNDKTPVIVSAFRKTKTGLYP